MLPHISPSPLASLKEPIGHPNWIHELKHDGFRGILYVDREQAWLVSRKGKKFHRLATAEPIAIVGPNQFSILIAAWVKFRNRIVGAGFACLAVVPGLDPSLS